MALRMTEPFEVLLADGVSRLHGRPGDWLVDYGDGSLGIVTDAIFRVTYEIRRSADMMASHQAMQKLLLLGKRLRLPPRPPRRDRRRHCCP